MKSRFLLYLFVQLAALLVWGNVFAVTFAPVKVAPNVYAFIGETGARSYENEGMNANAGFIVTAQGVVVVDSGSSYRVAKAMHEAIRQVTTQPVKYVINTGGQDHRWLGNGYFKELGVEIIASGKAKEDMAERSASQLEALRPVQREKLAGTQAVYPTKLVETREVLNLAGEEIQVLYFGGGHTPGDSVVWLPKSRVLFSGDLIYVDRLLGIFPFSNTRNWLASFAAIEKLNPASIVPGHGRVCDLAKARRETRDYLLLLRGEMKKAVDKGVDLQAAVDATDQSAYRYLENYEALNGGNANRTYLEMELE